MEEKGNHASRRGLLVKDGGGEWTLHPVVGEGQHSDSSIMQKLHELVTVQ